MVTEPATGKSVLSNGPWTPSEHVRLWCCFVRHSGALRVSRISRSAQRSPSKSRRRVSNSLSMLGFWPSNRTSRRGSGPATNTCSPDAAASCFRYWSAWSNSECSCKATRDASTWCTVRAAGRRWPHMSSARKATPCSLVRRRRGCGPNKNAEPDHKPHAAHTAHCLNAPMVGAWIGFAAGLLMVFGTLMSVAGTLVVPRAVNSPASRLVDWLLDVFFRTLTKPVRSFDRRDGILAWQAPMTLLVRLAAWLGMLIVGFAFVLLPSLKGHLGQAFSEAGSSVFTLGYAAPSSGDSTKLEDLA